MSIHSLRFALTFSSASFALALGACAHSSDPPASNASSSSSNVVTNERGIQSLAKARCEREAQCHNLAGGDNHEKHDCTHDVYDAQYKLLGPSVCASGIDKSRLDKCISGVQDQLCEASLGPIEGFQECRAERLCAQ
jgi:hypothetical protein